MEKSHLTAITRKTLPVPTKWLLDNNEILFPTLDYGCGKCHEINNQYFPCEGYDPYYRPNGLNESDWKTYSTIICNYVLCVIPSHQERIKVLKRIQKLLFNGGVAYITIRNDKPKQGWGINKRGTYQGRVHWLSLKLIRKTSRYRMYLLTKEDKL